MCLGISRARDKVPPQGTILSGEGFSFSHLLLSLLPMATVVRKIFGSARVVTTLAIMTLTTYIFYNLVYLVIFQLLRVSSLNKILLQKGPRMARRAIIDRERPEEHVLPSDVYSAHCVTMFFSIFY
jgi:hypothetical protein